MKIALLVEVKTDPTGDEEEQERYLEGIEDAFMLPDMEHAIADGLSIGTGYLIEGEEVTIHDYRRADRYRSLRGLP